MGIVTLTTDFGTADGYAGVMKGVLLSLAPYANIVDVSHEIPRHDVMAGAFMLAQVAPFFAPGTVHVAVVDPGVGGARADLVVEVGGSFFVGPDNGLLSLAVRKPRRAFRIENPEFRREPVSPTFHGRDVFAPTAARLATGHPASESGSPVDRIQELPFVQAGPLKKEGDNDGEVIHIDAFGNLVTSFQGPVAFGGSWELHMEGADRPFRLSAGRTFRDVAAGALVIYTGSGGQVEIAAREDSAATTVGVRRGAKFRLRRIS